MRQPVDLGFQQVSKFIWTGPPGLESIYQPVDLNLPAILLQGGLEPSEADPRFHQQMVYAVAMRTLENFDRALGRVIQLGSSNRRRTTTRSS